MNNSGFGNVEIDARTAGKLCAEYNSRTRAVEILCEYIGAPIDKRLRTEPLQYEMLFEKILKDRPNVYYGDKFNDDLALLNLKKTIKEYDDWVAMLTKRLSAIKFRYSVESVIALDKFSKEISDFVIPVKTRSSILKEVRAISSFCAFAKHKLGSEFKGLWSGHMSLKDAVTIARIANENNLFIDSLKLSKYIQWFEKIKLEMELNSENVINNKRATVSKSKERKQARRFIDSQIENWQLEQENQKLCLMLHNMQYVK